MSKQKKKKEKKIQQAYISSGNEKCLIENHGYLYIFANIFCNRYIIRTRSNSTFCIFYGTRELHPEYEYNVTPMVQCRADMNHGWRCSGEGLTVLLVKSECNNICDLTELGFDFRRAGVRMVQPIRVSRDSRSSGE